MIKDNVANILMRIDEASKKSNYDEKAKLVAVSKYRSIDELEQLYDSGLREFGENRVQELLEKYPHFEGRVKWHLIGTLQKNKVKYIIDKVVLIHSVDSVALAKEINSHAVKHSLVMPILLQVNYAKEESKHGFNEEDVEEALIEISKLSNVRVDGIMVMAPNVDDEEFLSTFFIKIRNNFDNLMQKFNKYDTINISILSMGMSGDFEIALQNGSNMVRVGSALFE